MQWLGLSRAASRIPTDELRAAVDENLRTQRQTRQAAVDITFAADDLSTRLRGTIRAINRRTRASDDVRSTLHDVLDRL